MYQTLCNLILPHLQNPRTKVLSPEQAGGRKGHTTVTQALALWSNVLQFEGNPYVVLLDIAKAHPSTPHALLWETMCILGVPPTMTLRHTYEHTQCVFKADGQRHMYRQKRVSKRVVPSSHSYFVWCISASTALCPAGSLR